MHFHHTCFTWIFVLRFGLTICFAKPPPCLSMQSSLFLGRIYRYKVTSRSALMLSHVWAVLAGISFYSFASNRKLALPNLIDHNRYIYFAECVSIFPIFSRWLHLPILLVSLGNLTTRENVRDAIKTGLCVNRPVPLFSFDFYSHSNTLKNITFLSLCVSLALKRCF